MMTETIPVFCPNTKREVIGLLKLNPSIYDNDIKPEYDLILCTGKINDCDKAAFSCPLSNICACKLQ
ncbi:MAG: hypothetical protein A4E52_00690 [Pelotomaculum sp. PtaB.Bin013]|uniref:Uncharacterized protein n=1 Tax=Pelotomaculum isophthalicicum JI TaxID=947010 RepID=A0A9X4H703_9FIRM|nr:hypothetical protein [Pelotomaculum isophthalicicum]MDF9408954.1 hypothetical protein [Pelotomaculum isophthalicicum JI]OPX90876.1 MAG: hypothetical protein A4E52_00690 [Pelotomaculum sp. PtaB.Bin013]